MCLLSLLPSTQLLIDYVAIFRNQEVSCHCRLIDIELMSEYSIQCYFYVASFTPFRGTRHCMQTAQSFNDFEIINVLLIIHELL